MKSFVLGQEIDVRFEHLGGELAITLLRARGSAIEVSEMDRTEILRALSWMNDSSVRPELAAR